MILKKILIDYHTKKISNLLILTLFFRLFDLFFSDTLLCELHKELHEELIFASELIDASSTSIARLVFSIGLFLDT